MAYIVSKPAVFPFWTRIYQVAMMAMFSRPSWGQLWPRLGKH